MKNHIVAVFFRLYCAVSLLFAFYYPLYPLAPPHSVISPLFTSMETNEFPSVREFRKEMVRFIEKGVYTKPQKLPIHNSTCIVPVLAGGVVYLGHAWSNGVKNNIQIKLPHRYARSKARVSVFFEDHRKETVKPQYILFVDLVDGHELRYRFTHSGAFLERLEHDVSWREQLVWFIQNGMYTKKNVSPMSDGPQTMEVNGNGYIVFGSWTEKGQQHTISVSNKKLLEGDIINIEAVFEENKPFGLKPQWILMLTLPNNEKLRYRFSRSGSSLKQLHTLPHEQLVAFVRRGRFGSRNYCPFEAESFPVTITSGGGLVLGSWKSHGSQHRIRLQSNSLNKGDVVIVRKRFLHSLPWRMRPQWVLEIELPDTTKRLYRFTRHKTHLEWLEKELPVVSAASRSM
ncbi:MAG: hypothetical protein GF384_00160 [Elusimicrobia bacterium]|nr:hypothetical protein [Elusimicrobiota bacterium]MBD3411509.1 hypothetical protein [Elusimicrobiota bacterium]